ncbi:hypothetical protein [Streptomyces lycii]|uniref:Uncharacterized protein n=1 Tax=Streptomyces lycii TaxID=2654337 RepID=A0ABQ7FC75_9ACTN|nr:hypothetical protein [Streptomyces lycii]KAF4405598.1 hypothetical protein GCU69_29485 [Streptomyces lycii]
MASPEALAARALAQAAVKLAQAASNPTVMVKHGRREDRAAAYDRFVQACATFYQSRGSDGVNDLYAARHSVELRAPRKVREAAGILCDRIVGAWLDPETLTAWPPIPTDSTHPSLVGHLVHDKPPVTVPASHAPPPRPDAMSTKVIADPDELRQEISKFIDLARADINNRWWQWPIATRNGDRGWWKWTARRMPFLTRWWRAR